MIRKLVGGGDRSYALETSVTDPKTMTLDCRSVNLTLSEYIRVKERCVYNTDESTDPHGTTFTQEARIEWCGMQRLSNWVEETGLTRFKENAMKGRQALEGVIDRVVKGEVCPGLKVNATASAEA